MSEDTKGSKPDVLSLFNGLRTGTANLHDHLEDVLLMIEYVNKKSFQNATLTRIKLTEKQCAHYMVALAMIDIEKPHALPEHLRKYKRVMGGTSISVPQLVEVLKGSSGYAIALKGAAHAVLCRRGLPQCFQRLTSAIVYHLQASDPCLSKVPDVILNVFNIYMIEGVYKLEIMEKSSICVGGTVHDLDKKVQNLESSMSSCVKSIDLKGVELEATTRIKDVYTKASNTSHEIQKEMGKMRNKVERLEAFYDLYSKSNSDVMLYALAGLAIVQLAALAYVAFI